jgi:aminobenzoyl-glutamate utilization protein B
LPELLPLVARVEKIAEGAALMTETKMSKQVVSADANLIGCDPLEALMHRELERLGPPVFDDADRAFAREIQATLSPQDIAESCRRFGVEVKADRPLCDRIVPREAGDVSLVGSTDVGTVSWVVPTVQMRGATMAIGTPLHTWQVVAQGKSPLAKKGMEHAAKIMASTALALIEEQGLIAAAKADHRARLKDTPFVNPILPAAAR